MFNVNGSEEMLLVSKCCFPFGRTVYSLFGHFLSLPFVCVTQSSSSGKADVKLVLVWGTRAVGGGTVASGGFSCLWLFWELEDEVQRLSRLWCWQDCRKLWVSF